jgi:Protein of unknown function (DUF3574)
MRIFAQAVTAVVLASSLSGTARPQLLECRGVQKPRHVAELTFGRSIEGRLAVSETQWVQFVDDEITPRFPDGLTVFDAAGQWWDKASNKIIREPSKIVLIVLPGNAEDLARLNEIAEAYKRSFRQQSVGMIVRAACVSF